MYFKCSYSLEYNNLFYFLAGRRRGGVGENVQNVSVALLLRSLECLALPPKWSKFDSHRRYITRISLRLVLTNLIKERDLKITFNNRNEAVVFCFSAHTPWVNKPPRSSVVPFNKVCMQPEKILLIVICAVTAVCSCNVLRYYLCYTC